MSIDSIQATPKSLAGFKEVIELANGLKPSYITWRLEKWLKA